MTKHSLGLVDVVAIGIGAMVGAGIFVLIGQVAELVDVFTWFSFALAGIISLLIGYVYARLAVYYPTNGGIVDYFRNGLSPRLFMILSFLYVVTLILTIGLVARAFGVYAAQWLHPAGSNITILGLVYTSLVLVVLSFLNMYSNHAVGRTEVLLVSVKLGILAIFIIAGLLSLKHADMMPIPGIAPIFSSTMFSGLGLTFFAYAGFNMMANAADKVQNPEKVMPRAFMLAIAITMFLYVALAVILVANLSTAELTKYANTSIAYAAYPVLGETGFILVSVGALLATSSAINATIFSLFNTLNSMGNSKALPERFNHVIWRNASFGNIAISVLILLMALSVNISILADVVSFTFLLSYFYVLIIAWRMRDKIHLAPWFLSIVIALVVIILIGFVYSLMVSNFKSIIFILISIAACYALAIWSERNAQHE